MTLFVSLLDLKMRHLLCEIFICVELIRACLAVFLINGMTQLALSSLSRRKSKWKTVSRLAIELGV